MTQQKNARFWNRIATRYAARPLKDVAANEAMLAHTATHLRRLDRVLEIGCGTGGTAIRLAPEVAQWMATDFSTEMVRIAQEKPAGDNLCFMTEDAEGALQGGPFDVICAFNVLHLVDDMPGLLGRIHAVLPEGGRLVCKTWCFSDVKPRVRALFPVLRLLGMFPAARSLSVGQLQQAICAAGFTIIDTRIFGPYPQNPYIIARKDAGSARLSAG